MNEVDVVRVWTKGGHVIEGLLDGPRDVSAVRSAFEATGFGDPQQTDMVKLTLNWRGDTVTVLLSQVEAFALVYSGA